MPGKDLQHRRIGGCGTKVRSEKKMSFPAQRHRRLRENPQLREWVGEHRLSVSQLAQPLFVKEGSVRPVPIASMPGQFQLPLDDLVAEAGRIEQAGIPAILLFGIPSAKDLTGRQALSINSIVHRAIKKIKQKYKHLLLVADVCLCEYLSHGHCGPVKKGRILNDLTLNILSKLACGYAEAGADVIAPSDMMDGRVVAIRRALDRRGFEMLPILSYAVKYASAYYAPFREAAENLPLFGDRLSYQMNPANRREALREAKTDLEEGADLLLVKPALGYTDIIFEIKQKLHCPVGAYSVSGEYSMIKAAAQNGWIDEKKVVLESHLSLKRAGADFIITYWARDLAKWL
jgi:porphobilinogen synthase